MLEEYFPIIKGLFPKQWILALSFFKDEQTKEVKDIFLFLTD